MSEPPFTMSKYASELELLRNKCAWLERELGESRAYAEQMRAALIDAKDFIEAARLAAAEYHRGWFTTAIWSIDAALANHQPKEKT